MSMSLDTSDNSFDPNPAKINKWVGQLRGLIMIAVGLGYGTTWLPKITDQQLASGLTALATVAMIASALWSWVEKQRQERAAKNLAIDSAVVSAQTGTPVVVAVTEVTPPGQPNIGVAIPVAPSAISTATTAELNANELRRVTS